MRTNDPRHGIMTLKVSGVVEKMVSVEPNVIRLTGKVHDDITVVVKVIPTEKYPFTIKELTVKNKGTVQATLMPPEKKDSVWQVRVINKRTRPGRYFDMITLVTDSALQPKIRINVFGNILE